jgi:hypothetical protein
MRKHAFKTKNQIGAQIEAKESSDCPDPMHHTKNTFLISHLYFAGQDVDLLNRVEEILELNHFVLAEFLSNSPSPSGIRIPCCS